VCMKEFPSAPEAIAPPVPTGRKNRSHADCDHPRTPAGRAACRKGVKIDSVDTPEDRFYVGRGKAIHSAVCGVVGHRTPTDNAVTCKKCLGS
jgi:hypothetical protein